MRLQAHYSKAKSSIVLEITLILLTAIILTEGKKPLHSILKRKWEHLGLWRVSDESNQNEQRMQVITSYQKQYKIYEVRGFVPGKEAEVSF